MDTSISGKEVDLVLGAGPAGISATMELANAGRHVVCAEKNDSIGGLSRTLVHGKFRTDIGPHRFFSQNSHLYDLIVNLLGEDWLRVDRYTRFYIGDSFFDYPVRIWNALENVGILRGLKILRDYFWERARRSIRGGRSRSVEDELVSNFGRGLAELNMLNYTEKIWGLHPSRISPDWTRQRIRGLSLREVMVDFVSPKGDRPKTMVDQFHYPAPGAGFLYDRMGQSAIERGRTRVLTESRPTRLMHRDAGIRKVEIDTGGTTSVVEPNNVISTIPVTELVCLLDPPPPRDVTRAAESLRFRSQISLFMTLDRDAVFRDQWIYFPDRDIPFGRIMEPRNFSTRLSPPGKTSLLVEFFCWKGDEVWSSGREALLDMTVPWLEELGFIDSGDIIDGYVNREEYAYPVYDLDYGEHRERVMGYLRGFENLQSIGRSGMFRYNNQDHAIEMGLLAAGNVLGGKRIHDLELVGVEDLYLERGAAVLTGQDKV